MKIIFVRHAKAEDRSVDLEDMDRHLTEKGIAKFSKLIPQLKHKIRSVEKQQIINWSSPANRAVETADIVIKAINLNKATYHKFIYTGNMDKFKKHIKEIKDDQTLMIYGHEPILSDWVLSLTGESVRIRKGAMICLSVTDRTSLQAKIEWHIQP